MCALGPDGSSGQGVKGSPKDSPLGQCFKFGATSTMSLRDVGGEEECFEYNCQNEEKAATPEQPDTLDILAATHEHSDTDTVDILEDGKCYILPLATLLEPFPVSV